MFQESPNESEWSCSIWTLQWESHFRGADTICSCALSLSKREYLLLSLSVPTSFLHSSAVRITLPKFSYLRFLLHQLHLSTQVYVTYAQAGYVSHDLEAEGLPCSVRFANFANTLSVGTSTGVVQLWDLKTRKVKKTFQVRWKIAGRQRIGRGKKLVSCQIVLKAITVTRHWRTRNEKSSLHGSKLIGVNVREIDVCLMSLY